MTKLPPHLEHILHTLDMEFCSLTADTLRAILEAAVVLASAQPLRFGNCGNCGSDWVTGGCYPDCPHHQLRAALEAPPADATNL